MVILTATLALAGCAAPGPLPTPTTKPTTSTSGPAPSTSTPEPTDAPVDPESQMLSSVTRIVVRPELLQLMNEGGAELGTISYDAAAETFVGLFTELLGAAPIVTDTPGGHEWPPVTHYTWDGFELRDDHETGDYQLDMNLSVTFTEPEIGLRHIAVSTIQGFKPGDDLRWLAKYMDEPFYEDRDFNQIQAEHGPPIGEQSPHSEYSNSNSVTGQNLHNHAGSVIFAPWNFGIGHV
jgi:hypothetical protein